MHYIKVWCEYDISGEFGGNNNEECMIIEEGFQGDIDEAVLAWVLEMSGIDNKEDLEDLYGWEFITLTTLQGE